MTNPDLNDFLNSPIHLTSLTLKPAGPAGPDDRARMTWSNFFRASRFLPPKARLGWQLAVSGDGGPVLHAVSGPGRPLTDDDLAWIFRDTMDASALPEGTAVPTPARPRLFALRVRPEALNAFSRRMSGNSRCYAPDVPDNLAADLLEILKDTGAVLRILTGPDGPDDPPRTAVLLALPQEPPLRIRAVLSGLFPFGEFAETGEDTLPGDCYARIPSAPLEDVLSRILSRLIREQNRKAAGEDDEDAVDDDDLLFDRPEEDDGPVPEDPDAPKEKGDASRRRDRSADASPLEVLDLSIRSFNGLRRAGIRTVGELRSLTAGEYRCIRGLGVRQIEEIRTKLARFLGSLPDGPEVSVDHRARLAELIGLDSVKDQVRRIEAYARMKQDMTARGIATLPMALNMAFLGNPGTAKTTVARILAGILHEVGILSDPEPVEAGRADLVGKYVGHTADKVREIFREARGRLLFIDEAYSLVDGNRSGFGDEAINTIVQEMENHRDGTVVVFAGYPREMEEFIARNPGLSSRIPFTVRFPDYSPADLASIARLEARRKGFAITDDAVRKVEEICIRASGRPSFGNGRYCRNLVENAILSFAVREYGSGDGSPGADGKFSGPDGKDSSPDETGSGPDEKTAAGPKEFVLTAADFEEPESEREKSPKHSIGFCA